MSHAPMPQTRFELAVHEGHQFTEKRFTQVKLLLSITDAHGWVAWYRFGEWLIGPEAKAFDNILMSNRLKAENTIQFGDGAIDRATIQLRRPRAVDKFAVANHGKPVVARIHDAKFLTMKRADGNGPAVAERLELALSLDVGDGPSLEIVRARPAMLSLERPNGNIHPIRGWLLKVGLERVVRAPISPSRILGAAAMLPG